MKVRVRLRFQSAKKNKSNHAIGKKVCALSLIVISMSLLNVFTSGDSTSNWSRILLEPIFNASPISACPHNITVDILSIGSVHRLDYLDAQRTSFASYCTVRNFFTVTEKGDADPQCESKVTNDTILQISNFCRRGFRWARNGQWFMAYMSENYASHKWVMKKKNPQGWVCAQTRPVQALFYVIKQYQKKNETFPDYLLIMDDDTYYNMKLFSDHFGKMDSSEPIAVAGCRVRSPVSRINFTFPFGGYGTTLSKGWLEKVVKPISCPRDSDYCHAIQVANHIGEKAVFKNGMTIAELMYGYSNYEPFGQRDTWTIGFCLHSDWFIGYFTNFYNISNQVSDPMFAGVPTARLGSLMESELNRNDVPHHRRICDFNSGNCHSMAFACHYSNPAEMKAITDKVRQENPSEFKPVENDCTDCDEAKPKSHPANDPILDIVSLVRNDTNVDAQEKVLGSDGYVRSFYKISESNTPDFCSNERPMKLTHANSIVSTCRSDLLKSPGTWLMDQLRAQYARSAGDDVPRWICEQRRIVQGVSKLLVEYQQNRSATELPDFLILLSDTTYFNGKIFRDILRNIENGVKDATGTAYNPSKPVGVGGCMRDFQISPGVFFRVPTLDSSIILNRAVLEGLLKPIHCKTQRNPLCNVIEQSQVGERDVFNDGMSAVDLMNAFATADMHQDFMHWAIGMCFEAEWLLAHFIQFYTGEKAGKIAPMSSLERANSPLHAYLEPIHLSFCSYTGADCFIDSPYCSGISADQMLTFMKS